MKLLTAKELGIILSVKPKTLYKWAAAGQIPSMHLNGLVRFDLDEVLKWIQTNRKCCDDSAQSGMVRGPKKWRQN